MAGILNKRPTYSLPAMQKYFSHIHLPDQAVRSLMRDCGKEGWSTSSEAKKSLEVLQKYQQSKIPFTNLYLHYSRHHVGTLNQGLLYEYLVNSGGIAKEGGSSHGVMGEVLGKEKSERERMWDGRPPSGGRGGTCTMNNGFFGTVMRSLGFRVKMAAARVAKANRGGSKGVFDGWNHLINLVEFEGRRHLVDVGFVANGPTAPILVVDGIEVPWGSTQDRKRIIWSSIPEFETSDEKCWILQHKRDGSDGWNDVYCFTDNECLPQDVEVMNWKSAKDIRGSFFNHMILCVRTVMEAGDVVGVLTMVDGKVKRRIGGISETLVDCMSEVERWEALEKWFGIVLGEQERAGIRGLSTELKGTPEAQ